MFYLFHKFSEGVTESKIVGKNKISLIHRTFISNKKYSTFLYTFVTRNPHAWCGIF